LEGIHENEVCFGIMELFSFLVANDYLTRVADVDSNRYLEAYC